MNNNLTELVFILDKSGSMSGMEKDTIGGFNSMMEKQKDVEGDCVVTTVLFDNNYQLLHDRINLKAINPITEKEYFVGGCTALLDAIGTTIKKIDAVQEGTAEEYRAGKVLFVIITDGEENSNTRYFAKEIKKLISEHKERNGWEFIFLGANIDAVETADRLGISRENAAEYNCDEEGTRLNYKVMEDAVRQFREIGCMAPGCLDEIRKDKKRRRAKKIMIGAIIGDIVGSVYEWHNIKTKYFPLFKPDCFFTDDTVMTCAVAEAIMNGGEKSSFISAMKKYGRMYPKAGYGGRFRRWLSADTSEPYRSFGNGSAMRVSPCAWAINCDLNSNFEASLEKVRQSAQLSAEVTHNHPEGIKGALATADAIFLCRAYFADREKLTETERGGIKLKIKEHLTKTYGYNLSFTLDEIRPSYKFDATCQGSVPQAIVAFLESTDFEDAIRNAISIGGDSDTIAAITGSIAEAAYGISKEIKEEVYSYLDVNLKNVLRRWKTYIKTQNTNS